MGDCLLGGAQWTLVPGLVDPAFQKAVGQLHRAVTLMTLHAVSLPSLTDSGVSSDTRLAADLSRLAKTSRKHKGLCFFDL